MPDYQNDLIINENKLDEEWISQPSKMMNYSADLAQAIYNRNRAKENLDVIEASLDSEARKEPTPAGLGKATETAIKNWIKLQEPYREALEAYHDSDLEVNLLQGGVNAFQHRKTALENLVKLFLAGYFSEPNLGEEGKTLREKAGDKVRDDLNAALNKPLGRGLPVIPPPSPPASLYAIGPSAGGFTNGPFPSIEEATNALGDDNEFIFLLDKNSPPKALRRWSGTGWVPMEADKKPKPIPIRRQPK